MPRKYVPNIANIKATRQAVISVFRELNKTGIVARANFTDCQSCGGEEISEIMDDRKAAGEKIRGYVFWHRQDNDNFKNSGYCYLAYGSLTCSKAKTEAIGNEIVKALKAVKVRVKWNGDVTQRILIQS